jgi:hypothetical protein
MVPIPAFITATLMEEYKTEPTELCWQKKNSRSILRAAAVLMTRRTQPTQYDTTL